MELLLAAGADISHSAIYHAVADGSGNLFMLLGTAGADLDSEYSLALMTAVSRSDGIAIVRLLSAGANPNSRSQLVTSPLDRAIQIGSGDSVRLLLTAGTDVNARSGSALQIAVIWGYTSIGEQLLDGGADVNARCGSALQYAI